MQTQVDEITHDKHLHANLLEFIEAVGRVADKVSLPPIDYQVSRSSKSRKKMKNN